MDHWIHVFLQVHIMLLPRLPVLSALLLLLLAAGRCTKAARRRSTGTLDGRSMLEQVGRYPRSRTEPVGLSGVRTPGHGQYLNSCCYWCWYWYYWWCSCAVCLSRVSYWSSTRSQTDEWMKSQSATSPHAVTTGMCWLVVFPDSSETWTELSRLQSQWFCCSGLKLFLNLMVLFVRPTERSWRFKRSNYDNNHI